MSLKKISHAVYNNQIHNNQNTFKNAPVFRAYLIAIS